MAAPDSAALASVVAQDHSAQVVALPSDPLVASHLREASAADSLNQPPSRSTSTFTFLLQNLNSSAPAGHNRLLPLLKNTTRSSSSRHLLLPPQLPQSFLNSLRMNRRLLSTFLSRGPKMLLNSTFPHLFPLNPASPKFTSSVTRPKRKQVATLADLLLLLPDLSAQLVVLPSVQAAQVLTLLLAAALVLLVDQLVVPSVVPMVVPTVAQSAHPQEITDPPDNPVHIKRSLASQTSLAMLLLRHSSSFCKYSFVLSSFSSSSFFFLV